VQNKISTLRVSERLCEYGATKKKTRRDVHLQRQPTHSTGTCSYVGSHSISVTQQGSFRVLKLASPRAKPRPSTQSHPHSNTKQLTQRAGPGGPLDVSQLRGGGDLPPGRGVAEQQLVGTANAWYDTVIRNRTK
jgi:hypothetical protein